jgi:hypothetical protein
MTTFLKFFVQARSPVCGFKRRTGCRCFRGSIHTYSGEMKGGRRKLHIVNFTICVTHQIPGDAQAHLVGTLRYKPEGCRMDSPRCYWHNPSSCIMALGSTQPPTEISNRSISWGVKPAAGGQSWQPYHLYGPTVLKSGDINILDPSGLAQACTRIDLPLHLPSNTIRKIKSIGDDGWGITKAHRT